MGTHTVGIWDKPLGKELAKVVPPGTTRVIVDIPCDGAVCVYYQCFASESILNLNWENALSGASVISASDAIIPDKSKVETVPENGADPFVSVANHSNAPEYYKVGGNHSTTPEYYKVGGNHSTTPEYYKVGANHSTTPEYYKVGANHSTTPEYYKVGGNHSTTPEYYKVGNK